MTPTTTDHAALLFAAIAADPGDDVARAAYADLLMENGDPRGEFVQVQLELARTVCSPLCNLRAAGTRGSGCVCTRAALRRRERELLAKHWPHWTQKTFGTNRVSCAGNLDAIRVVLDGGYFDCSYRRGHISHIIADLGTLVGGECENCDGFGTIGRHNSGYASTGPCPDCGGRWESGEPGYSAGTGTTPGILAALFRAAPTIEGVRVTGKEPADRMSINGRWYWFKAEAHRLANQQGDPSVLPSELFELLPEVRANSQPKAVIGQPYLTDTAAHAALSAAVVRLGRERAGLPPLPATVAPAPS